MYDAGSLPSRGPSKYSIFGMQTATSPGTGCIFSPGMHLGLLLKYRLPPVKTTNARVIIVFI